jgi:hypothetical protein
MKLKLSDLNEKWPKELIWELKKNNIEEIVSLKYLNGVFEKGEVKIVELPLDFVIYITKNLVGLNKDKPYEDANIELVKTEDLEVNNLYAYQTFVQKNKLNNVKKLITLDKPSIVLYENKASLYFPPIIDVYSGNQFVEYLNNLKINYKFSLTDFLYIIRDGTHRVYNHYKNSFYLPSVLLVEPHKLFIPSLPIPLYKLKVVDEKPEIEKRYLYLKKEYWIDLKGSGIDG